MEKTRGLFKNIRDTKGTFHTKMCTIKDRHGKDPSEEEEIKKSSKTTQRNCTEKIFMTWTTMVV